MVDELKPHFAITVREPQTMTGNVLDKEKNPLYTFFNVMPYKCFVLLWHVAVCKQF